MASLPGGPSPRRRGTFSVGERLRLTKRFREIHRRGMWLRGHLLALGFLASGLQTSRVGIRVRRGVVRSSVSRNHLKRLLREAYRRHKAQIAPGHDLVLVICREKPASIEEFSEELVGLCKRARILL